MKLAQSIAAFASGLYILGLVVLQTHLLRYGILELASIDLYYFFVGGMVIVTLAPAVLMIAMIEFVIRRLRSSNARIPARIFEAIAIPLLPLLALAIFLLRFDPGQLLLDFSCYIYPRFYVYANLILGNAQLACYWLLLSAARYRDYSGPLFRGIAVILLALFFAIYASFFGRTVYPAISQGAGGGAPLLSKIITDRQATYGLLLHKTSSGIYYLKLAYLPNDLLAPKEAGRQSVGDESHVVHKAVIENRVSFVPRSEIKEIIALGLGQEGIYQRYMKEEKHYLP